MEIFHDEESVFTGIFFQDEKMRAAYSRLAVTVNNAKTYLYTWSFRARCVVLHTQKPACNCAN